MSWCTDGSPFNEKPVLCKMRDGTYRRLMWNRQGSWHDHTGEDFWYGLNALGYDVEDDADDEYADEVGNDHIVMGWWEDKKHPRFVHPPVAHF